MGTSPQGATVECTALREAVGCGAAPGLLDELVEMGDRDPGAAIFSDERASRLGDSGEPTGLALPVGDL